MAWNYTNTLCVYLWLKCIAMTAAAHPYCTAVALTERFAESVSFQWHQPGFPPTQNVNLADTADPSAVQFSGSIAICAEFAAYSA